MQTAEAAVRHDVSFDEGKAKAFAGQMLGTINGAAVALMTSIGHRTGLFDHLARHSPTTSAALAAVAGLNERYVREWLAVMTTARIVDYTPADRSYTLPPEHAAFLTRDGAMKNLAVIAQFVGVVGALEDEVVDRFRHGGGLCYHHYDRFHEVMAEASHQSIVKPFVDQVLPIVPGLRQRLEDGIDVVDLGCGAGRAVLMLAQRFPRSRFVGLDLCADAFRQTQQEAARMDVRNLVFRQQDLAVVERLDAFDLVLAFDAVHDQKSPLDVLRKARQALRRDGLMLMVEFGGSSRLEQNLTHPIGSFLYMMSVMHCMPVSLGQGGEALGTMWGVELAETMLRDAGFGEVQVSRLPHDPFNAYFVAR